MRLPLPRLQPGAVTLAVGAAAALLAAAAPARAQSFPADDSPAWVPLECGVAPMVDGRGDEPDAIGVRDLVGDRDAPAAFRAVDDGFLYLRLRLDESPDDDTGLVPFAWGVAVDLDDDDTDYELLLAASGGSDEIAVRRNTAITVVDSPRDPADEPAVTSYPFASHGRTSATVSGVGGDDGYLALAVPFADLAPLGLNRDTPIRTWAGSSTGPGQLDGDLACHDAGGGSRDPSLSDTASDREPLDPAAGPGDDDGARLEGGGGCTAGGGGALLVPLLALLAVRARRSAGPAGTRA